MAGDAQAFLLRGEGYGEEESPVPFRRGTTLADRGIRDGERVGQAPSVSGSRENLRVDIRSADPRSGSLGAVSVADCGRARLRCRTVAFPTISKVKSVGCRMGASTSVSRKAIYTSLKQAKLTCGGAKAKNVKRFHLQPEHHHYDRMTEKVAIGNCARAPRYLGIPPVTARKPTVPSGHRLRPSSDR